MLHEFIEELWDEASDFFEDIWEHVTHKQSVKPHPTRTIVINGVAVAVRPAYLFAERVDNTLKIIFGLSIILSAITATFLGFTKLSDLLEVLISSLWGRTIMMIIGLSYLITAFWKLLHLSDKPS